jgi:DNA-binding transcriptional ArsR family regulator
VNSELRALASLDRVIHEPGRLLVMALLASLPECDFLFLLNETELSKGNLSSHLSRLEEAGYLELTKRFHGKVPQTVIRLTYAGRSAYAAYRRTMQAALGGELH